MCAHYESIVSVMVLRLKAVSLVLSVFFQHSLLVCFLETVSSTFTPHPRIGCPQTFRASQCPSTAADRPSSLGM